MILFISKLKRNASFPTCSKSTPEKKALKLLINNFTTLKFQIGANYQAKSKSLDFGISLPQMLLKLLYGVRGDAFALL